MASIGVELQKVLDLAPEYTRMPSPSMRARDEACKHLQDELRKVLAAMPAGVASGLDVGVGGRQASYSPLAWIRIYSPERSPGATAGVYLAYLFAADGSRVYLSLQQGSSEFRSGQMRPVRDSAELLAGGDAARSAIRNLIDSPLGAGMTTEIDLGWRRLSSVGSYSKQRIGNYEYANILAIQYDSGGIPATDALVADLYRGVALLTALYGDATRAEDIGGDGADPVGGDWSAAEITAVVDDYMTMLQAEITGQPYSKAGHRRALLPKLHPIRTGGAVEFKHQNISAAMIDLGLPYICGYKPLSNYQAALTAEIQRHLEANPRLLRTLEAGSSGSALPRGRLQRTPPPEPSVPSTESPGTRYRPGRHPNYGLLQKENERRGKLGEELVVGYERDWLRQHDRPELAEGVRWTAREDGDGLGYDVLSFDLDGYQRYIEVKATALGAETPFYISSAELDFAQRHADRYALYRVYNVLGEPRFFALEGDITHVLKLTPIIYTAQITAFAPADSAPAETL